MRVDGYVMTTPVVISNNAEYASISLKHIGECNVGEEILSPYDKVTIKLNIDTILKLKKKECIYDRYQIIMHSFFYLQTKNYRSKINSIC